MVYQGKLLSKTLAIGIIILFIGMSFNPSVAVDTIEQSIMPISNGKTLYVGGTGPGNYSKILKALLDAVDGDTVFVYDDRSPYNEFIRTFSSINLIGENKNTTIINANNDMKAVLELRNNNVTVNGFTLKGGEQGIKIMSENNTISNNIITENYCGILSNDREKNIIKNNLFEGNDHYGIKIDSAHDWIITNNILKYNDKRILFVDGNNEIKIEYTNNIKVSNNVITTDDANCIFIRGGSNNTISDNVLYSKSKKGIYVYKSNVDNKIIGNKISNCGCYGIRISAGDYYTIKNNTLKNNGFYIINSYENIFENNIVNGRPVAYFCGISNEIIDDDLAQIFLMKCNNITIENQNINDSDCGVLLWDSQNCNIINNNIYSNQYHGIYIWLSNFNNIISHNRIYDNANGIYIGTSKNVTVQNNFIKSNDKGINLVEVAFCSITHNNIKRNNIGVIFENFEDESQQGNTVECNNFILNNRNAYFYVATGWFHQPIRWKGNFWSRPRLLPKLIFGGYFVDWYWNNYGRPYRWIIHYIFLDLHPALKPYKIGV